METSKSYKITFRLDTPMSITEKPTFDALLSYCYAKQVLGDKFYNKLSYSDDEIVDFSKMPLELNKNDYFMASSMIFNEKEQVKFTERWRKRWANEFDSIADFGKTKRRVQINKKEFKSYDMPLQVVDVEACWFYFKSNNINAVQSLIENHLFAIGKKASQGYGIINSYDIKENDFDYTQVFRPIPVTDNEYKSSNVRFCSFYPPYWDVSRFNLCYVTK